MVDDSGLEFEETPKKSHIGNEGIWERIIPEAFGVDAYSHHPRFVLEILWNARSVGRIHS